MITINAQTLNFDIWMVAIQETLDYTTILPNGLQYLNEQFNRNLIIDSVEMHDLKTVSFLVSTLAAKRYFESYQTGYPPVEVTSARQQVYTSERYNITCVLTPENFMQIIVSFKRDIASKFQVTQAGIYIKH